jgi:hypothetical protein
MGSHDAMEAGRGRAGTEEQLRGVSDRAGTSARMSTAGDGDPSAGAEGGRRGLGLDVGDGGSNRELSWRAREKCRAPELEEKERQGARSWAHAMEKQGQARRAQQPWSWRGDGSSGKQVGRAASQGSDRAGAQEQAKGRAGARACRGVQSRRPLGGRPQ